MPHLLIFTALALLAFAGNSVLCRLAALHSAIDGASFTTIRLLSGAGALALLVQLRKTKTLHPERGNWRGAALLFAYAALFSYAYENLPTATGSLLLFGAVQLCMTAYALLRGERISLVMSIGIAMALGGLVWLLLPGLTAPPLTSALLMLGAGTAWAAYSLLGRDVRDPLRVNAGNFARALPLAVLLSACTLPQAALDMSGITCAVLSGALSSGIGYAIWYRVLPQLHAAQVATIQLSVPLLASVGGVLLLQEPLTTRLLTAGAAVLGGITLVALPRQNCKRMGRSCGAAPARR